jgi:hypothetical protein
MIVPREGSERTLANEISEMTVSLEAREERRREVWQMVTRIWRLEAEVSSE